MGNSGNAIRGYKWIIIAFMAAGAAIACYGITYIEPRYLSDFYFRIPLNMMVNRMEPGFYKHPSLTFDLMAVIYWLYFHIMKLTGQTKYIIDFFADFYFFKSEVFYALGRSVSVLSFAGVIGLTARLGRRLWNERVGLFAAFLALCSYALLEYSHAENVDMSALFLMLVVFDASLSAIEKKTIGSYAAAGAALGLAISANYPAAAAGVFIAGSFFTGVAGRTLKGRAVWAALAASAAAGALFTATSPYSIIAMKDFVNDVLFQSQSITQSSEGRELRNTFSYYFDYLFKSGGGLLVLGIPGMILGALKGKSGHRTAVAFVILLVGFFQTIATKEARWVMPAIPFLCIFSSWMFICILERVHGRVLRIALAAAVVIYCVSTGVWPYYNSCWMRLHRPDRRLAASEWLLRHVSPGSVVFYETNTVYYKTPAEQKRVFSNLIPTERVASDDRFSYYSYMAFDSAAHSRRIKEAPFTLHHLSSEDTVGDDAFYDPDYVMGLNARWIVLNGDMMADMERLYEINPRKYAKIIDFYNWVKSECEVVERFEGYAFQGTKIIIYRAKPGAGISKKRFFGSTKPKDDVNKYLIIKPGKDISVCISPMCESLRDALNRDLEPSVAAIYNTQTRGGYRLIFDLPGTGRAKSLRVSILKKPSADVRCYSRVKAYCIQHYSRNGLSPGEEDALRKVGETLSRWHGAEWPE